MSQERNFIENGFVVFPSAPDQTMLDVANSLGRIFKVPSMPLVQTLTPRTKESEPDNTYSGNYGTGEFPFHTDLAHWYTPPRYFLLRCIIPGVNVKTNVVDCKEILRGIEPELLCRSHFLPRKRLDRSSNLLKIYNGIVFRWDSIFIEPANKLANRLQLVVAEKMASVNSEAIFLGHAGDCLLIDNWRMLHGRSSVCNFDMNRKIERVYFNEVNFER